MLHLKSDRKNQSQQIINSFSTTTTGIDRPLKNKLRFVDLSLDEHNFKRQKRINRIFDSSSFKKTNSDLDFINLYNESAKLK